MRYQDTLFYDDYGPLTPPSIGPFTKEEDLHEFRRVHGNSADFLHYWSGIRPEHQQSNQHQEGEMTHVGTQEGKEHHAVAHEPVCTPQSQGTSTKETP